MGGNLSSRLLKKNTAAGETNAPKKACTGGVHTSGHHLCMNCERETICRNCTYFVDTLHCCKLCKVALELTVTQTHEGTEERSTMVFASAGAFEKQGITRDRETGAFGGCEQLCRELDIETQSKLESRPNLPP